MSGNHTEPRSASQPRQADVSEPHPPPELSLDRLRVGSFDPATTGVIYPFGTLEQHGSHLPLGTDRILTEEIARRAATRVGNVVVAPAIPYGCSEHHLGFSGTHAIGLRTLAAIVGDLLRSARISGFRWALLLNGHGGNRGVLETAAAEAAAEARESGERELEIAICHYWALIDRDVVASERRGGLGSMSHACEFETSLMLEIDDGLVGAVDEGSDFVHDDPLLRGDLFGPPRVARAGRWIELESTGGVRGRPSLASAEAGEKLLESAVVGVAELLARLADEAWARKRPDEKHS